MPVSLDLGGPCLANSLFTRSRRQLPVRFARQLRVEERAELAGLGVSTLHHDFRALTAMSPLQYQKHIRLQEARARISIAGSAPLRDTRVLRSADGVHLEPPAAR